MHLAPLNKQKHYQQQLQQQQADTECKMQKCKTMH